MFEKEAEEYSENDLGAKYLSTVVAKDKLHAYKLGQFDGFVAGAEFGYDKANEWHYPSKGEYPKDEFTDEYTKSRLPSAYKRFYCLCLGNDFLVGKYIRGLFHTVEGLYSLSEIIAWREVVLPELKESE